MSLEINSDRFYWAFYPCYCCYIFFSLKKKGKRIDFFITGQPTWQRLSCHMAHFYTNFDLMCITCLPEANVKMTIVSHFWAIARGTLTHSFMVISGHFKSFSNSTIHKTKQKLFCFLFQSYFSFDLWTFTNYSLKLTGDWGRAKQHIFFHSI